MQLNEVTFSGQLPIDAYAAGYFKVEEKAHYGPMLILPSGMAEWAGLEDVNPLLQSKDICDVLLIGMGEILSQLPKDLRKILEENEIPFEIMSSPSACRTYNVLLSEGRRVGIAALPV